MSLLQDPDGKLRVALAALWHETRKPDAGEPESMSFWQHLIAKHEFPEAYWVCDAEMRPAPGSRKRIDRGVRFVDSALEITVLCWVEGKGKSSTPAKKEAEAQALRACRDTLAAHQSQKFVYALTTALTEGKAWIYSEDTSGLQPLDEGAYVEANSANGRQISQAFKRMRQMPPAVVLGAPNPNITSQGPASRLPQRPVAAPFILQSNEPQTSQNLGFRSGVPDLISTSTAQRQLPLGPEISHRNPLFPREERTLQLSNEPQTSQNLGFRSGVPEPISTTTAHRQLPLGPEISYRNPLFPREERTLQAPNGPRASAYTQDSYQAPSQVREQGEPARMVSQPSSQLTIGQKRYSRVNPIIKTSKTRIHLYYQGNSELIELDHPRRVKRDNREVLYFEDQGVYIYEDEVKKK